MGKEKCGEVKICACCGKEFYVPRYRVKTARFCSLICQNHGQYSNRTEHTCEGCGKTFLDSPSRKKRIFCSVECRVSKSKDEKIRRQDTKKYVRAVRGNGNSRNARKIAFAIYPSICMVCKVEEHSFCLDVHHMDENPTNNTIDNLAILCAFCHRKVHKKYLSLIGVGNAIEVG